MSCHHERQPFLGRHTRNASVNVSGDALASQCTRPLGGTVLTASLGVIMMTSLNGNILRVTGLLRGNSPVTGEFPAQKPVTRIFDVFFDLRLNKRLSKQSWGWCFETPSSSLCRYRNALVKRTLVYLQLRYVVYETHLTKSTHSHPGSVDGILSQENAVILPIGSTSVLIF